MPIYRVEMKVLEASGHQTFLVEADSKAAAEDLVENGGGVFESQDVEVTHLGPARAIEEATEEDLKAAQEDWR